MVFHDERPVDILRPVGGDERRYVYKSSLTRFVRSHSAVVALRCRLLARLPCC